MYVVIIRLTASQQYSIITKGYWLLFLYQLARAHSMLFLYVHIFNLTLYLLCYFLFKADMIIISSQSQLDGMLNSSQLIECSLASFPGCEGGLGTRLCAPVFECVCTPAHA